jgi:hypothetical protein
MRDAILKLMNAAQDLTGKAVDLKHQVVALRGGLCGEELANLTLAIRHLEDAHDRLQRARGLISGS